MTFLVNTQTHARTPRLDAHRFGSHKQTSLVECSQYSASGVGVVMPAHWEVEWTPDPTLVRPSVWQERC